ncbi:MAG TPA: SDR family oxidoreductase [Candidatus Limnocylindrales bacterium]|nr:SDR family oxidoreductase [Candidatus Limnocylindrales bacterium]
MTERPVAIVTGAASGIGHATAQRLLADGWHVVGVDLRDEMPAGVEPVAGDAAEAAVLGRAVELAGSGLDGLVCAAGVPPTGPWDDLDHWHEALRVDLTGVYLALRVALPALTARGGSAVIVGSIVGSAEGSVRSPAYAAAKSGLVGLVRSMALLGAPDGVRVNLVEPGAIDTPFDAPRYPPDRRPDVPLGRMGTAAEVAGAICFLLGRDAAYITGARLRVDGGRTIRSPSPP